MRLIPLLAALGLALAPALAVAQPKSCPPGLAKKSPPCIPPGQAKKLYGYEVGDILGDDGYVILGTPWKYGLEDEGVYYHRGNVVLRVDPETRKVLDLIGAIDALLE